MNHLVILAAFTILGSAIGWCAAHMFGPDHNRDRQGTGTTQDLPSERVASAPTFPSHGTGQVGGPTPLASIPVAPRSLRTGSRGWNLAPTHPVAPRPALYDWETDGAA